MLDGLHIVILNRRRPGHRHERFASRIGHKMEVKVVCRLSHNKTSPLLTEGDKSALPPFGAKTYARWLYLLNRA